MCVPALGRFDRDTQAIFLDLRRRDSEQTGHLAGVRSDGEEFRLAVAKFIGAPRKRAQSAGIENYGERRGVSKLPNECLRSRLQSEAWADRQNVAVLGDLFEARSAQQFQGNAAVFVDGQGSGHVFGLAGRYDR